MAETSRPGDLPIDRVFKRPPWKSRAFWIWTIGSSLLTLWSLAVYWVNGGSFGDGEQATKQIITTSLDSAATFTRVTAPAYLLFLILEAVIHRARLNPTQSRIAIAMAFAVSLLVFLLSVIFLGHGNF